jgi:hypothetical protein
VKDPVPEFPLGSYIPTLDAEAAAGGKITRPSATAVPCPRYLSVEKPTDEERLLYVWTGSK